MRTIRLAQIGLVTALALGGTAIQVSRTSSPSTSAFNLEAAFPPTLYERVQATCGACHNNDHFTTAGDFKLNSGANVHAGGIVAQTRGIDPTVMVGTDTKTALLIQKPLAGSITPHGGIKLAENHPTMVALMDWVSAGAPSALMDPPASVAPAYRAGVPGGSHEVLYTRRPYRRGGFRDLIGWRAGGELWIMRFDASNNITSQTNLTLAAGIPATDDVINPSVSLDGSKLVFSRKRPGTPWKVWEMNMDGTGLRQITTGSGDDIQPYYLPWDPQYASDPQAAEPARAGEGGIGFTSNRPGFRDEYEASLTLSLFVCDANGGNLRQIGFNPSHDVHPFLHSSGVTLFTRWEHNEHQGHNFMPLFAICASDWRVGGTNLFGAFGEHNTGMGNSLHEPAEDYSYSALNPNGGTKGWVIARGSMRDDAGGSIVGPLYPKLETPHAGVNVIMLGDDDSMRGEMNADVNITSITFRTPRSLLNGLYAVSVATLTATTTTYNEINMTTSTVRVYSDFKVQTFVLTGTRTATSWNDLLPWEVGFNYDEITPVLVKQTPPRVAKPIDRTMNTGVFTSGDVTERQADGQPLGFDVDDVSAVRFIRALQFSQGSVDTGRDTDEGIATQIIGDVPIRTDGSFAAEVPAEVPIQFELLDRTGRVKVAHKPWVQVMRGETMRCVGCHSNHSAAAKVQTLEARQIDPIKVDLTKVRQFHFKKDLQPMLNEKCVRCHDYALAGGAAGGLSLVGRPIPGGESESYQSLIGKNLVRTQSPNRSPFMWRMTGLKLDAAPGTVYPTGGDPVPHSQMLTDTEIKLWQDWISAGINFRVVSDGEVSPLANLNTAEFTTSVWPILENNCLVCHTAGGQGGLSMNLDGDPGDSDSEAELVENRIEALSRRINFMVPQASYILRKPLGERLGGLSHVGGQFFTGLEDPQYQALYRWISAANPALAPGVPPTDLVNVENHPNPFRDSTIIVYRLQGSVAATVTVRIYSQQGKMLRDLPGPADVSSTTMGWNKVEWDGNDKNGRTVASDVYFYSVEAKFNDGTKKTIRGKCVKVK